MDAEVVRRHVHVSNCHQRAAHVNANRRALVRVIVIVIAHVADVRRRASRRLKILNTLHIFARVGSLLLLLALVRQICFIAARRRQFALRGIPIFVHIYACVHLLGLLWSNCSALSRCCTSRARYLVPFTLSGAFDSVALRIGPYLGDLVVSLPRSAISEGVADAELLLEVFLSLLGDQLPSLRCTGASDRRAAAHYVGVVLPIGDSSLFDVAWLVRQSVYH